MSPTKQPFSSPFAQEYFNRGLAEGLAEGEAKGRAEGRVEGVANALLMFLYARTLQVTDEDRARIAACTSIDQLRTWVVNAAFVSSAAAELF